MPGTYKQSNKNDSVTNDLGMTVDIAVLTIVGDMWWNEVMAVTITMPISVYYQKGSVIG